MTTTPQDELTRAQDKLHSLRAEHTRIQAEVNALSRLRTLVEDRIKAAHADVCAAEAAVRNIR